MSAVIEIQDDASAPITSKNFGAIDAGDSSQQKLRVQNVGDQSATGVQIQLVRTGGNDGLDYGSIALDQSGNPGAFTTGVLTLGTLTSGASVDFWVKFAIPAGTTPAGNPRQADVKVTYTGT